MTLSTNLCSVNELHETLENKPSHLCVLDSSWYLPNEEIDTKKAFNEQHIPSAAFFDINLICDQQSSLPHMLPRAEEFATAVGKLGVSNKSDVVIYDTAGIFSAARVWWMFKVFGHNSVRVLNGGLPAWVDSGGTLTNASESPINQHFNATLQVAMIKTKSDLIENCQTQTHIVLDARPTPRFLGQAAEPRPGLPSGHMPHSHSLPASTLLDNGHLKAKDQLRELFSAAGIYDTSSIITSCGSGVTAAIITLALAEAGFGMHSLYDGSWVEWASSTDTEVISVEA